MNSALEKLIKIATATQPAFTGFSSETSAKLKSKKEGRPRGLAWKLKDGSFAAVGPVGEDGSFKLFGRGSVETPEKVADLLSDEEPAPKARKPRAPKAEAAAEPAATPEPAKAAPAAPAKPVQAARL